MTVIAEFIGGPKDGEVMTLPESPGTRWWEGERDALVYVRDVKPIHIDSHGVPHFRFVYEPPVKS